MSFEYLPTARRTIRDLPYIVVGPGFYAPGGLSAGVKARGANQSSPRIFVGTRRRLGDTTQTRWRFLSSLPPFETTEHGVMPEC